MNKKQAFTLAEAIVTLTIISIVIVLTIVKLIKNDNQAQFDLKYKKISATIESNISAFMTANTGWTFADFTTNMQGFNGRDYYIDAVTNNLTVKNNCKDENACWSSNPQYKSKVDLSGAQYLMLNDDTVLAFKSETTQIVIDLNGPKGPNVEGKDIRIFTIANLAVGR